MAISSTFLAPGQRYVDPACPEWRTDRQVTIVCVRPDPAGVLRVAYRGPRGHELVEPATQIEAAVAAGQLRPVAGSGRVAKC
jgi:hypothetical protein